MTRGRPKQALLSQELIVTTALKQIDEDPEFSLSKIARELGVHVSSLYNHVGDRESLIELMRERITTEQPTPSFAGLDWRDAVRIAVCNRHAVFSAHPYLIPLLVEQPVTSPAVVERYDQLSECFILAGFDDRRISLMMRLIDGFALGAALTQWTSKRNDWQNTSEGRPCLARRANAMGYRQ